MFLLPNQVPYDFYTFLVIIEYQKKFRNLQLSRSPNNKYQIIILGRVTRF
jgi:hypothetical protein